MAIAQATESEIRLSLDDHSVVKDVKLTCVRLRKVNDNINELINLVWSMCPADNEMLQDRKADMIRLFSDFKGIFVDLRRREDFTVPEVDDLQNRIDDMCQLYIDMFGPEHITNY